MLLRVLRVFVVRFSLPASGAIAVQAQALLRLIACRCDAAPLPANGEQAIAPDPAGDVAEWLKAAVC